MLLEAQYFISVFISGVSITVACLSTCMDASEVPTEPKGELELGSQTAASSCVGAGNQTCVLDKEQMSLTT